MVVGGVRGHSKYVEMMIAASAGESVIAAGCILQHGSLLVSSMNLGHLSCTCCRSLQQDIADPH
jgi:hypothetical protein